MRRCVSCLLPSVVPGSDLDASGVCAFRRTCRPQDETRSTEVRNDREADLETALRDAHGKGRYDVLVCLSGGKDSEYVAFRAKADYKLNVLASTVYASIPDVAWSNMWLAVEKLGVDHLVSRPPADRDRMLFRFPLRNQVERGAMHTFSYVYAPLFEDDALTVATQRGIPLFLVGYSSGQTEKERLEYEVSRKLICETDWTPPGLRVSGEFSETELARFWNPRRFPLGTHFPRYLAPFHVWEYD